MDPRQDIGPETSAYIRNQGSMPWKMSVFLTMSAMQSVRQTLDESPELTPAHLTFQAMQAAAHQGAESALRQKVGSSRALTNLLNTHEDDADAWYRNCARRGAELAMIETRGNFTNRYGFAVITPEAINQIAELTGEREVLEVGAGNGYLAHRLAQAGINVLPTDAHRPERSGYQLGNVQHTDIINIDAETAIRQLPEMDLLWSWPCQEEASGKALQSYDGRNLIYIGEQDDGCTGGDLFNRVLEERFTPVEFIGIPSFPDVHDCVGIYRRR